MKTLAFWPWLILNKASSTRTPVGRTQATDGALRPLIGYFNPLSPSRAPLVRAWALVDQPNRAILATLDRGPVEGRYLFVDPTLKSFRRFLASRSYRSLDHSFLVAGLHRFGEQLSGASFSLLVFRNLLEIAHPRWVLEVFSFYGRLSQLFSLSRSRNVLAISSPNHPWYGGAQIIVSSVCTRDPFLLTQ
jgi:hypothetical protein